MITYCTNIHPGESWEEIFSNLNTHVIAVKKAVSPHAPFPVGLRLSSMAASGIDQYAAQRFLHWLEENDCFVPTINGFPYGSFHVQDIKEKVYLPDWRSTLRVEYTKQLADLLGSWLPEGVTGSISTVPVGFRSHVQEEDFPLVRQNLLGVLEHMDRIRQKTGREIILSLEPEPGCILETANNAVAFFDRMNFPEALRTSLGICLDLCHQAVEFETPRGFLETLSRADIRIGKVQVSSGLRLNHSEVGSLGDFAEPCYLHQVVVKDQDGTLTRYNDIPEALSLHRLDTGQEWRSHFHVPIYAERTTSCSTTRSFIEDTLPLLDHHDLLLEIETYTWQVLPEDLRAGSVIESVIREFAWLTSVIRGSGKST